MITVILVIFDYAERVDDFTATKAPMSAIIFDYYINFVPDFINQFSGLFTFIAVIFFTSKMAYQTEIVAMLSGGMRYRARAFVRDDQKAPLDTHYHRKRALPCILDGACRCV